MSHAQATHPSPPDDIAIAAYSLTRHFGHFVAVDDVSFEIRRGAIFGFLGPNGSGKSTVTRMICGLLAPTAGTAFIDGLEVTRNPREIRQRLGYMAQKFSLYSDLTVLENMRFAGRIYGLHKARRAERIAYLVDLLGLGPYLDRRAGQLSGGWKQRLALGAALIHEPRVLFLDEPTAGIDPVARRDLWDLLFRLSGEGVTILVTTHYMDEAERCSQVAYLYLSKLLAVGTPSSLKALPAITPPGERWLELRCPNPARIMGPIRALPDVVDATVFGEVLHLRVSPDCREDATRRAADAQGQSVTGIREIAPSLEDVFVTLTRQAGEERRRV